MLRSFGIFYIGQSFYHLGENELRTLVYLNLAVGGIFTLYAARTRLRFWSIRPATILLTITVAAQLIATFFSVYGLLMTPIGWKMAGIVWGYCVVMFLVQDQVKLAARRVFGEEHSGYYGRHVRRTG